MFRNKKKPKSLRYVVALGCDGPISNSARIAQDITPYYANGSLTNVLNDDFLYCLSSSDKPDRGIYITNIEFLKLTCEIMTDNGVLVVPGSKRLAMIAAEKEAMYRAFDIAFGQDRTYLLQGHGRVIGNTLSDLNQLNKSKLPLLNNISLLPGCGRLPHDHIILLDSNESYAEEDNIGDYAFLSATPNERNGHKYDSHDNEYLFRALTYTVSIRAIYETLDKITINPIAKSAFKSGLLKFHLENLEECQSYQARLLHEEYPSYTFDPTMTDLNAKAALVMLGAIQHIILHTKWQLTTWFWLQCGGETVKSNTTGEINAVPTYMKLILNEISAAQQLAKQGRPDWQGALCKVSVISQQAIDKQNTWYERYIASWFRTRDARTTQFYGFFANLRNVPLSVTDNDVKASTAMRT